MENRMSIPANRISTPYRGKLSGAVKVVTLPGPFSMYRGDKLPQVSIAYETWGRLNASKDNAILLFTGLSPGPHAASSAEDQSPGWWEYMIGPGKPIDTNRFFVICINSLGSCFGSTGPSSIDPRYGRPYRLDFPELSVEDIAVAGREAIRVLGIFKVHAVVGASLGGMSALTYAVLYPEEVKNLVAISAAANAAPFAIAVRSLQREIIRSDPAWKTGMYENNEGPREGIRLARKLGLISYRSAEEWSTRFGRDRVTNPAKEKDPFGVEFQIESYLEANAEKFVGEFDANSYLYLSRAMDLFDVAEHWGSVEQAFGRIQAERALVMGVETDFLFPPRQQTEIANGLRNTNCKVDFTILSSIQGHDSFLVDKERFGPVLQKFFSNT